MESILWMSSGLMHQLFNIQSNLEGHIYNQNANKSSQFQMQTEEPVSEKSTGKIV